jgi:D-tyrosyl-tRNA(Tyr) deacylase
MRVLIQRVSRALVTVEGKTISSIKKGLLVFVGIKVDDTREDADFITKKLLHLRLFASEKSFADKSIKDLDLEILLVSQFTLYARCRKGNRPAFDQAMNSKDAKLFYDVFVKNFKTQWPKVQDGVFGAEMQVELVNDGPVTILLESEK